MLKNITTLILEKKKKKILCLIYDYFIYFFLFFFIFTSENRTQNFLVFAIFFLSSSEFSLNLLWSSSVINPFERQLSTRVTSGCWLSACGGVGVRREDVVAPECLSWMSSECLRILTGSDNELACSLGVNGYVYPASLYDERLHWKWPHLCFGGLGGITCWPVHRIPSSPPSFLEVLGLFLARLYTEWLDYKSRLCSGGLGGITCSLVHRMTWLGVPFVFWRALPVFWRFWSYYPLAYKQNEFIWNRPNILEVLELLLNLLYTEYPPLSVLDFLELLTSCLYIEYLHWESSQCFGGLGVSAYVHDACLYN